MDTKDLGKMSPSESTSNRIDQTATNSSSNNSRTSLIGSQAFNKPIGIRVLGSCFRFNSQQNKKTYHKVLVLLLTFIAYAAFHMGRRPLSVVKNVLNRNCSTPPNNTHSFNDLLPIDLGNPIVESNNLSENNFTDSSCDSWAPFDNDSTANQLLATLDSSFLLSYAIFMFVSGMVGERMNLRYFITIGSILSGLGAAQSTGWPAAVTCVSNWFGKTKKGLIFGIWNSHTNLGNIFGAVLAGLFVEYDWGLSFLVPGAIMIGVGIILFLFLVPRPQDVHLGSSKDELAVEKEISQSVYENIDETSESYEKIDEKRAQKVEKLKAVSFFAALRIPGVIEYSLCLFFSKLVNYTFLYWLPKYIKGSTKNNSENSAYLSTPFDVGGVAGGIVAGYFSDKYNTNGITCTAMLIVALPSLFLYQKYGPYSSLSNITLQLLVGILVNGPYSLITTAVSADLGTRIRDGRAMTTVTAIIDGMGSVGAVLGPLFAGLASKSHDWQAVFIMLMLADVFAAVCLLRITVREFRERLGKSTIN